MNEEELEIWMKEVVRGMSRESLVELVEGSVAICAVGVLFADPNSPDYVNKIANYGVALISRDQVNHYLRMGR